MSDQTRTVINLTDYYYKKTEIDDFLNRYYTKEETDNKILGTFTELQNKITEASQNSIINLTKNYQRAANENRITINKNLQINGNNHYLSGNNAQGIFFITDAANITINNLILKDATRSSNTNGTAISLDQDKNCVLTVNDCTFTNNTGGAGVGIFVSSTNKAYVNNCIFSNNTAASTGSAIYSNVNGGTLRVTNSIFTNNIAQSSAVCGGVITDCVFKNNDATGTIGGGGAREATYVNCIFDGNTVSGTGTGGATYKGIAVNCQFLTTTDTVNQTTITDNLANSEKNLLGDTRDFSSLFTSGVEATNTAYQNCIVRYYKNTGSTYKDVVAVTIPQEKLTKNTYYTLSFWAKATTEHDFLRTFFHNSSNQTTLRYASNSDVEGQAKPTTTVSDGNTRFKLTTSWQRYYVTYMLNSTDITANKTLLIRLDSNSSQPDIYLAGIQFEKDINPTNYISSNDSIIPSFHRVQNNSSNSYHIKFLRITLSESYRDSSINFSINGRSGTLTYITIYFKYSTETKKHSVDKIFYHGSPRTVNIHHIRDNTFELYIYDDSWGDYSISPISTNSIRLSNGFVITKLDEKVTSLPTTTTNNPVIQAQLHFYYAPNIGYTASKNLVTDSNGRIATEDKYSADESTLTKSSSNQLSIKDGGVTSAKIANGTITNDDISSSAAIAYSKLSGVASSGHSHSNYLTNHNPIDSSLSSTSTNAVQNKVINSALANKAASDHNHSGTYVNGAATKNSTNGTAICEIKSDTTVKGTVYHPKMLSSAVSSGLYKVAVNTDGHITGTTNVVASDLPAHNHTKSQITDLNSNDYKKTISSSEYSSNIDTDHAHAYLTVKNGWAIIEFSITVATGKAVTNGSNLFGGIPSDYIPSYFIYAPVISNVGETCNLGWVMLGSGNTAVMYNGPRVPAGYQIRGFLHYAI